MRQPEHLVKIDTYMLRYHLPLHRIGMALVASDTAAHAIALLLLNGKYSYDRGNYQIFEARKLNPDFHVFYPKPLVEWDNMDGFSAYEIAVKYGYTGTEEEFAEMLMERTTAVLDVQIDSKSVVSDKIANIDSTSFGKVDDVKIDGESVVTDKVASIDSSSFGKVKDVTVDGESVLDEDTGTASITMPTIPTIPVTDVLVDDKTVLEGTVAKITTPSIPVTDVKVGGTSVVTNKVANITIPSLQEYIVEKTLEEYDALTTKDSKTIYRITNATEPFFYLNGTLYEPIDNIKKYVALIYTDLNSRVTSLESKLS